MLTKLTGLKILVSSVFTLISLNILVNYLNNVESVLSIRRYPKLELGKNHSNEVEEARKNFNSSSVITDYVPISKINKGQHDGVEHDKTNQLINIDSSGSRQKSLKKQCTDPAPDEGGPVTPNTTLESLEIVEEKLKAFLKPGGWFQPAKCRAKHHVAIIVPFRDRYAHLSIFLKNIHIFLMKQNIEYRIFIIEQTNGKPFNRAALMNVGYLEALKYFMWDCFIFHDLDLLPLDDRNLYTCPRQPRHMSVAIDTFGFRLPYKTIFGGVSAMTREQFLAVNGFSNSFFGWGGEDDDMSNRLKHANLYIARYPINIARYMMLTHQKERANPKRYENLVNGAHKFGSDGLNSIQYEIYSKKEFPIFTWYLAELKMPDKRCQS